MKINHTSTKQVMSVLSLCQIPGLVAGCVRLLIEGALPLFLPLALLTSQGTFATDNIAARLAQGHLSAAYCIARPERKPKQVVAIYREIIPVAAPPGSYTTVAFTGGYVGLAGNKTAEGGDTINFSIWGKDAKEVEPADKTFGTIKTRQFTHEGTGWAGRLAYRWKTGTRYHVFIHVQHENDQTLYTAWFGEANKNEWLLAGRIRKAGTHYLGSAGGFLEHAGKKDAQIPRCTGYGTSWVHDGQGWRPCTMADASVKDPGNARFYQRDDVVYIEIGLGLKSDKGNKFSFPTKALISAVPKIPEPVFSTPFTNE
jgi:hypothetical protein